MIDTKEIEKVSKLFGIRKISDNEHCGTLSSANCPVHDMDMVFYSCLCRRKKTSLLYTYHQ